MEKEVEDFCQGDLLGEGRQHAWEFIDKVMEGAEERDIVHLASDDNVARALEMRKHNLKEIRGQHFFLCQKMAKKKKKKKKKKN